MKIYKKFIMPMALTVALSATAIHAQPNPDDAPNAPNPANDGRGGRRGGGNRGNMTPAQRQEWQQQMQQRREQGLRQMLTEARFTEPALQNAVVGYVNEQEQARQSLQEKARLLNQALRNPASTDAQITTVLADFRAAVAAEKTRRTTALTALEKDTSYSKNPRLDATLTMMGIIGDEASFMGGIGGMGGMGGRGGAMGRFGGPGGGGQGGRRRQGGGGGGQ
jgi:hypothetical protein